MAAYRTFLTDKIGTYVQIEVMLLKWLCLYFWKQKHVGVWSFI